VAISTTARKRQRPKTGQFVGYIRVSTDEQACSGLGLAAQRELIEREAAARSWELSAIHEDAGMTGTTLVGRPGLEAALSAVTSGQADGLVVAKLDRLSRSLLDFANLMERSRREQWGLVALDLGVDTSTPQGELMASVLATFAQFERRLIGERTKSALAAKAAQGVQLGRPRTIPESSIERILELRTNGLTYRAIADQLNAERVATGQGGQWHGPTVYRALKARDLVDATTND
jgi:DNA invertase Pin-like site-specific DNA recombinase